MELWAGLCLMEGKVQEEESAEKKKDRGIVRAQKHVVQSWSKCVYIVVKCKIHLFSLT